MFLALCILTIYTMNKSNCASYQRYGDTTQYPRYTTASMYNQNQFPFKSNYGSDIAPFPEATRYPNYKPTNTLQSELESSSYNSRGTGYGQNTGTNYGIGQNTGSNYVYGQNSGSSYGQDYNSQSYGGQGYTSYETPFMKYNRDYCVNRSPQTGIWVDSLKGMWYGVEFIQHLAGDARVDYVRSCIVIHISEPLDKDIRDKEIIRWIEMDGEGVSVPVGHTEIGSGIEYY